MGTGSLSLLVLVFYFLLLSTTFSQSPKNLPRKQWIPHTQFPAQVKQEFPNIMFEDVLQLRMFKTIEYPASFLARLPIAGDYLLFLPFPDSTLFDYCQYSQQTVQFYNVSSCSSFFCENEAAGRLLSSNNATERKDYAKLFNYCLYCSVRDTTDTEQIREFLRFQKAITSDIQTCPYAFQHFNTRHCGETGFPLLSNETIVMEGYNHNRPFLCYCPDSDMYGGFCDAYTTSLNFANYYVKNWIFVGIAAVLLALLVLLVVLPGIKACFFTLKERKRTRNLTVKYTLVVLCDLRHQCILFLMLALILFIITQVLAVLEVLEATYWIENAATASSNFRIISAVCVGLSYAAFLVLWASYYSIAQTLRKNLTWQAKLMMAVLYLGLLIVILLMVLLRVLKQPDRVMYSVVTSVCVVYTLTFPIGFTIYGMSLYCVLRRGGGSVTFRNFKIARFMMLSNLNYLVAFIIYLLVTIGYIVGWDYLGYALGSYRNALLDVPNLVVCLSITLMLYIPKHILDFYKPILPSFVQKLLGPNEIAELNTKTKPTATPPEEAQSPTPLMQTN